MKELLPGLKNRLIRIRAQGKDGSFHEFQGQLRGVADNCLEINTEDGLQVTLPFDAVKKIVEVV